MKVELISWTLYPDILCDIAARACTSQNIPDMDDEWIEDASPDALRSALASGHESVIEHAVFTFSIEGISRACSHQLVRHRMASYSQQSQRYVKMSGKVNDSQFDFVTPESIGDQVMGKTLDWRTHESFDVTVRAEYECLMQNISNIYNRFIELGVPEEDARYLLPNACTTNLVMTMNARELRHFFKLRLCKRAQWEIRELAERMLECVKAVSDNLFYGVGPACKMDGKCPEMKPCRKVVE